MTERTTTAPTGARRAGPPALDRRLVPPMVLGSVLNPINSTVIAVALVPIGAALGASPAQTAWLVSALYLATALGQPVVGRLIDLFGPRRLFLASTSLVGVAGVVGTLAPNLGTLIAARVVLGFGTCAGYPAAMALLRAESRRTGQESPAGVLTLLAVANQTVAVVGPLLGGLLTGLGGWRSTFALNIPLSLLAVTLGALRLPRPEAEPAKPDQAGHPDEADQAGRADQPDEAGQADGGPGPLRRIDLPGMALFAVLLLSLLLFLMHPHADRWYLPPLTLAAAAAFTRRERRTAQPFIDVRVLGGNTPLLLTYARALAAYVVAYAFLYGFAQWTEEGFGLTPLQAGLVQAPTFLVGIGVSVLAGRRGGVRTTLLVGAAGQIAACLLMLALGAHSPLWALVVLAVVFGIPQGANGLALQNSVFRQSDPARTGSSAGLLRTFAYLGSMVAAAATAAAYGPHAGTAGMHHLAWVMLAAAVLFLLLTAFDRTLRALPAAAG
ncbi:MULTISPECIES: MFS transporter [Kitasatospora]|uniref:Putative major facilitator superfamily transporter n=1 Tax=Kitasatospora setae (strain ATCC 33774 / DSM 43861 / JCM 3304 / KCC A-0304 / NBRC 14216 / KM-6054) TaxID=452652 RepID=E4N4J6_KITSK|nr:MULTISPECIES: MFS transporter [Kitasatospora]BAJ26127.1 putative major facilitator superfamily transporter [Kitasatospora setae KM-6054]